MLIKSTILKNNAIIIAKSAIVLTITTKQFANYSKKFANTNSVNLYSNPMW